MDAQYRLLEILDFLHLVKENMARAASPTGLDIRQNRICIRELRTNLTTLKLQIDDLGGRAGLYLVAHLLKYYRLPATANARDDLDQVTVIKRPNLRQIMFPYNHLGYLPLCQMPNQLLL